MFCGTLVMDTHVSVEPGPCFVEPGQAECPRITYPEPTDFVTFLCITNYSKTTRPRRIFRNGYESRKQCGVYALGFKLEIVF